VMGFVAFGVSGFMLIEGWTPLEALYMTIVTISTVGFKEVHELSPDGRVFTLVIIVLGVLSFAVVGASIARLVVENEIKRFVDQKEIKKKVRRMKKHYIVCGFGRSGSAISYGLKEHGITFVVIEQDETRVARAERAGFNVLRGNATEDSVLMDAGIEKAAGIVAALNDDAENLFVSLSARQMKPEIFIVARCENPDVEKRLSLAGADVVISPLKLGGMHIAELVARQQGNKPIEDGEQAESIARVQGFALSSYCHQDEASITVAGAVERTKAVSAVAIKKADGTTIVKPGDEVAVEQNESVIVLIS